MNIKTSYSFIAGALLTIAAMTQANAFTAQVPISGYKFTGVVNVVNSNVGALTSVYTVPVGQFVVITDVYIALSSGASGNHTTYIADDALNSLAGPFPVTQAVPFSKSYTSGIALSAGQQIIVSDTGGTGDVTVNIVGYTVCAEPC
jgi:hypothetical protein